MKNLLLALIFSLPVLSGIAQNTLTTPSKEGIKDLKSLNLLLPQEKEEIYDSTFFGDIALEYLKSTNTKASNENTGFYANIFEEDNTSGDTEFGRIVAKAGDFNGDGYDDYMIGAPFFNDSTGRVYVYFGSYYPDTIPDLIIDGEFRDDKFGFSLSTAGDINNDGYDDIIIGAYAHRDNIGKAYVYYGSANPDNISDIHIDGNYTREKFGFCVSSAGDINNDGFDDIAIGAPEYYTYRGRVYIYFGGPNMDNTQDLVLTDNYYSYSNFGFSISSIGDFDDDGYDDIVVGAPKARYTGIAYIIFGGLNSYSRLMLIGYEPYSNFGSSVSGTGDLNRDGYNDVLVGNYGMSDSTGRVYIYYGGERNNTPDLILAGENTYSKFGITTSVGGDLNNDGYDDIIIGAPSNGYRGKSFIFFGSNNMDSIPDIELEQNSLNENFGFSVAFLGDINNDGYDDVISSASTYNNKNGRAYIYFGNHQMDSIYDLAISGEPTRNFFGLSVSSAGDVNNDGFEDIIIGANQYNNMAGRAYIYYGGINMDNVADVVLTGEGTSSGFGNSVACAGDINRDGYDDIIVGAMSYSNRSGAAYVYFGGETMDNKADIRLVGETIGSGFGCDVSGAGDFNRDGYDDLLIGTYWLGKVYVYYGGEEPDNIPDVVFLEETPNDWFGSAVSNAGDINNDGYSDVIVGACGVGNNRGKVYLYYGGRNPDNIVDIVYNGETDNSYFGHSVSTAGDVNNDGFDDILIGADQYNNYTGRAYLFYGGATKDNVEDVIFTGESYLNNFGCSVKKAGDINNDGYDDIVIGAFQYSNNSGRVYAYYGGESMDSIVDIILTPITNYDEYFGYTVSAAGDINNDGLDDLIIGARDYPLNGAAYLYLGMEQPEITTQPENLTICENNYGEIRLTVAGEGNMSYQWQVDRGDGFEDIFNEDEFSNENTNILRLVNPSLEMNGYLFRCLVENHAGSVISQTAILTVLEKATIANAGPDQEICQPSTVLNGNIPDVGAGTWTTNGNAYIEEPDNPNSTVSDLNAGENLFVWEISNGMCSSTDTVTVFVHNTIEVDAGPDVKICNQVECNLFANEPSEGYATWTIVKGTGNINSPNLPNTIITELGHGENTFRWTIEEASCTAFDDVTITNYEQIIADAGEDIAVCDQTEITLSAIEPSSGEGLWSSTNEDIYFDNAYTYNATVYNLPFGTTTLHWTVTNGACTSSDELQLNNNCSVSLLQDAQIKTLKTHNIQISCKAEGDVISYQWRKDGVDLEDNQYFSGTTTNTFLISKANSSHYGNYDCKITGVCNEIETSLVTLSLTSENETLTENNIQIYPNPSNGIINIDFDNVSKIKTVEIYHISGKKVFHKEHLNTKETIDLSAFTEGNYVITIRKEEVIIKHILTLRK